MRTIIPRDPLPLDRGSILLVDPDPRIAISLEVILGGRGPYIEACAGVPEAAGRIRAHAFDLLICDLDVLDQGPLPLGDLLTLHSPHARLIVTAGRIRNDPRQAALERQLPCLLLKPFEPQRLAQVVRGGLDECRRLREERTRLELLEHEKRQFEGLRERLGKLATKDALTGLNNAGQFHELLSKEIGRARRHRQCLSLVMLDLDGFKRYNDTYGHPQGDLLLQEVAEILQRNVRNEDIVSRNGGDEFSLLLPMTARREAVVVAQRVLKAVQSHVFGTAGGRRSFLNLSAGVAGYGEECREPAELVAAADEALYRAKRLGKGRVEVYGRPGEEAPEAAMEAAGEDAAVAKEPAAVLARGDPAARGSQAAGSEDGGGSGRSSDLALESPSETRFLGLFRRRPGRAA